MCKKFLPWYMCMAYIHANLILDQEYSSILFRDTCLAYKVKVTYK